MTNFRFLTAAMCGIASLTFVPAALADSAGTAGSSDFSGQKVDLDFTSGGVDLANKRISAGVGYNATNGGTSANVDLRRRWLINPGNEGSDAGNPTPSSTLTVDPRIVGRIDLDKGSMKPNKIDLSAGELGLFYGQALAIHEKPADKAYRLNAQERWDDQQKSQHSATEKLAKLTPCMGKPMDDAACAETRKTYPNDAALKAAIEEQSGLSSAALGEQKRIESDMAAKGFKKDGCYAGPGYSLTGGFCQKYSEVSATADTRLVSVSGVYNRDTNLNLTQYGARFKILNTSFHVAGRVNGVNLHMCGEVIPIEVVAGVTSGRESYDSMAKICAGIGLGPVGDLTNTLSGVTDWNGYAKVANEVELKKVGGLPMSVGYTYEYETTRDGLTIHRNLIGGKVSFE